MTHEEPYKAVVYTDEWKDNEVESQWFASFKSAMRWARMRSSKGERWTFDIYKATVVASDGKGLHERDIVNEWPAPSEAARNYILGGKKHEQE